MKKLGFAFAAVLVLLGLFGALSGFAAEVRRAVDPLGPHPLGASETIWNDGSREATFPVAAPPSRAVPVAGVEPSTDGRTRQPDRFIDLAAAAEGVAIVSVASSGSFWSTDRSLIQTEYTLLTETPLLGKVPAQFRIVGEGGEVDGVGLAVSDAIAFRSGIRYAVLLESLDHGPRIVGQAAGIRELGTADRATDRLLTDLQTVIGVRSRTEVVR